jgi:alpha-tubulin suppressor-like RCC1 family protein
VKSLFTQYISPVLAQATLTMGALLLSACGASVTEQANLPNGGTVTAVVSPSRVVAGQIYTYEATSTSGTTVTWSWGDGSPDTVGNTVQKVWNRPGSQTVTLSATGTSSKAAVTQSVVVAGEPVSAGGYHTCALQGNGTVLCWGSNQYGQLGDGTTTTRTITAAVTGLTDAVAISTSLYNTCALKSGGSVVCWGWNTFGQLGDGTQIDKTTPVAVAGLTDAVAINSGFGHACALKANGTVVCWGNNGTGQLGDGTQLNRTTTVAVTGLTDVASFTMGFGHTCAVKTNGTVACWGNNFNGQLGNGTTATSTVTVAVTGLTDAVAVSASISSSCALKTNGSVVCWGGNTAGQLGNGSLGGDKTTPVAVTGLTDAVALTSGEDTNGLSHSCALRANGSVACWGGNFNGQVGDGSSGNNRTTTVAVTGLTDTVAISAGVGHTCALKASGAIACWGNAVAGQLGDGSIGSIPTNLVAVIAPSGSTGLLTNTLQVSSGYGHTCALKNDGKVFCWGYNLFGQLGNPAAAVGNQANPIPTAVIDLGTDTKQITAGTYHTCALKTDGKVLCWGNNQYGQLGNPAATVGNQANPTPTAVIDLGTDTKQISAGGYNTCALKNDGKVMCWGYNVEGQLGNPSVTVGSQANPTPTAVVDLGTGTQRITTGFYHTCALKNEGTLLCWGSNQYGQLGNPAVAVGGQANPTPTAVIDLGTDTKQISAGGYNTCALKNDGKVLCWGYNLYGQLGNPTVTIGSQANPTPTSVIDLGTDTKQVTTGDFHTCVFKSNGKVLCWGYNQYGQLGNPAITSGTQANPTPAVVVGVDGTSTRQLNASDGRTCALQDSGKLLCWGSNQFGELGALGNPPVYIDLSIKPEPTPVLGGSVFWR